MSFNNNNGIIQAPSAGASQSFPHITIQDQIKQETESRKRFELEMAQVVESQKASMEKISAFANEVNTKAKVSVEAQNRSIEILNKKVHEVVHGFNNQASALNQNNAELGDLKKSVDSLSFYSKNVVSNVQNSFKIVRNYFLEASDEVSKNTKEVAQLKEAVKESQEKIRALSNENEDNAIKFHTQDQQLQYLKQGATSGFNEVQRVINKNAHSLVSTNKDVEQLKNDYTALSGRVKNIEDSLTKISQQMNDVTKMLEDTRKIFGSFKS